MSKRVEDMSSLEAAKTRAAYRLFYAQHAEEQRARHKEYYARNRARVLAQKAARRKGPSGDSLRALNRRYQAKRYRDCPWVAAAVQANVKAWRFANPHKKREYEMRRNARKRQTTVCAVDYDRIWRESDGLCGICDTPIRVYDQIHFDHIVPLARGGTHTQDNIQVAHARCNITKSDKLPNEVITDAA